MEDNKHFAVKPADKINAVNHMTLRALKQGNILPNHSLKVHYD